MSVVPAPMTWQNRCEAWVGERFPNDTPDRRLAKLLEEAGEVGRAVVGRLEDRPNRGDVGQECAQVVLVLLSLLGLYFPEYDLIREVERELTRVEADPTSHRHVPAEPATEEAT